MEPQPHIQQAIEDWQRGTSPTEAASKAGISPQLLRYWAKKQGKESTRPGRIDRAVFVGTLDYAGRYKIALRVTRDPELATKIALESEGRTGAQVQERATKAALRQLWGSEVT